MSPLPPIRMWSDLRSPWAGRRQILTAAPGAVAVALVGVAACSTTPSASSAAAVAADAAVIQQDVAAMMTGTTPTAAQLQAFLIATAQLVTDTAALAGGGSTASAVSTDITDFLNVASAFIPDVLAVLSFAATPTSQPLSPAAAKLQADLAKFRAAAA